jgi:hypothetical protein
MADRFPIERYLVPPEADPIPGGTSDSQTLVQGLPEQVQLDADFTAVVALPTGVVTAWRDADPAAVVSSSAPETDPWDEAPDTTFADADRAPLRLLVLFQGSPVASVPLAAGTHRFVPDDGGASGGGLLELRVNGWQIAAGNLQGPGDFGSTLDLDWQRLEAGTTQFVPPPVNPHVVPRLQRRYRLESMLVERPRLLLELPRIRTLA